MTKDIASHDFDIYDLVPSDVKAQAKQAVLDASDAAAKARKISTYLTDHWLLIAVCFFIGIVMADVVSQIIVKK